MKKLVGSPGSSIRKLWQKKIPVIKGTLIAETEKTPDRVPDQDYDFDIEVDEQLIEQVLTENQWNILCDIEEVLRA